ncbi:hypothetical protein GJAV_G00116730 [Gymnothorax javanicus]|nr:hypothetical protein GJAV_G00116730 [Gymnothorax javanicus]
MDSENVRQFYEDNREADMRSSGKSLEIYRRPNSDKDAKLGYTDSVASNRARTRTRDPDRDRMSDSEKYSDRYNSDEYENTSLSDPSLSLSRCSQTLSFTHRNTGGVNQCSSRKGLRRKATRRTGSKQPPPGIRSQSKDSSLKELDLVTKRVLSARLLKINEQRNELSELQSRLDQLQRENNVLRQLQRRQEKALHRFEDTENEITQLISRHNNEVLVLRERLRRAQERERTMNRQLHNTEDELRRCRSALQTLRKLAEERQLEERAKLTQKLAQALERIQQDERRIKELERNMELSSGSFQRQIVTERKKTHKVQEEVQDLQEELKRVTQKLKEKERELNTRNIYANRIVKETHKKDMDCGTKRMGPSSEDSSRFSTKGVQTDGHLAPLDLPTILPAMTDIPEDLKDGSYFSLKELPEDERMLRVMKDECPQPEREKEGKHQGLFTKALRVEELHAEKDEELKVILSQTEESRNGLSSGLFQVQLDLEEEKKKSACRELEKQEEEQRRKEQLLAKMLEIDRDQADVFSKTAETKATSSPLLFPEPQNQHSSTFSFPESMDNLMSQDSSSSLKKLAQSGRRSLNAQGVKEDLSFGSYAPSFGQPVGRAGPPAQRDGAEVGGRVEEQLREVPDIGLSKEKKSNLMQQLFGSASSAHGNPIGKVTKMDILTPPPPASKAAQQNGKPFPWETSKKRESVSFFRENSLTRQDRTLEVVESSPTVRAIASFDDDIEEVTL